MLYSEQWVRDNLRNREGKRVFFLPRGAQLTSGARDFLARERIQVLSEEQAEIRRYRLLTGGYCEEKPEHMTHLHGDVLVPKTHPRIIFRGKLDSFQAELILCQLAVPEMAEKLGQILALSHRILRCDVLEEELEDGTLCGLTQDRQRRLSQFPQETYGIPHFMPGYEDGPEIAALNKARCAAREAELSGAAAFRDREGNPTRPDLLRALNRISSMLYILMIEKKAGKL